jgi:hypothetical protein
MGMGEIPGPERGHNVRGNILPPETAETAEAAEIQIGTPITPELRGVLDQLVEQAHGAGDKLFLEKDTGLRSVKINRSRLDGGPYAGRLSTSLWLEESEEPKLRMFGNVVEDQVIDWSMRYQDLEINAEVVLDGPSPDNQRRAAQLLVRYAQTFGIPLEGKLPD